MRAFVMVLFIGFVACEDSKGTMVSESTALWTYTYHIREYANLNHNTRFGPHEICKEYKERPAVMDENVFNGITKNQNLKENGWGWIWIDGFDETCKFQEFIDDQWIKKDTSCWGKKRSFLCKNSTKGAPLLTESRVFGRLAQCRQGTKMVSPTGNENSTTETEFWVESANNGSIEGKCILFNLMSGESESMECGHNSDDRKIVGALCYNRGKAKAIWIVALIAIGSFIIGIIFSGIFFLCSCRTKSTKSNPQQQKKSKRRKRREEDSGAYAEIVDMGNYDNPSTSRSQDNQRAKGGYDKAVHTGTLPYTQPCDLISHTKGDYAEPYQHFGAASAGKNSQPPSPTAKEGQSMGSGGRSRFNTKMRAPEVPPPGIPSSEVKVFPGESTGGEYADPIEMCQIHITEAPNKEEVTSEECTTGKKNDYNATIEAPIVAERTSTSVVENDLYVARL